MDIGIFGGCVSRDIFRLFPENDRVNHYFARTSLITQFSEPVKLNLEDINLTSSFQKRLVVADFNKTLKNELNGLNVDYYIIDFLVERLSLLSNGKTYITRSKELSNSGIINNKKYKLGKVVYRKPEDMLLLHEWFNACDRFIECLIANFKPSQIILNQVYLTDQYIDNSEICKFDDKTVDSIKDTNTMLKMYYSYFKGKFPGIHFITLPEEHCIADANHQWGLHPMHFVDKYYFEARQQLNKIYMEGPSVTN